MSIKVKLENPIKNEELAQTIQQVSRLKIKTGFTKWVTKTMNFFNITENLLNYSNCIKIVTFINSSSSHCSYSYWILYKNYNEPDAKEKAMEASLKFAGSAYKEKSRSETASRLIYENKSRGYSGYLNIDGREVYCRSTNEFIAWNLFANQYGIDNIKYEYQTFNINGLFQYRPDFFIFDKEKLIKVIEIKNNDFIDNGKYSIVSDFFKLNGIDYELITDLKKRVDSELLLKIKLWKESDRVVAGNKGERNPRYGVKLTNETKNKISTAAKKRCEDPAYIEKISKSQKRRYEIDPTLRERVSEIAKIREANMSEDTKNIRREKSKETWFQNHYHNISCAGGCGDILYINRNKPPYCKKCKRIHAKTKIAPKMGISSIEKFFDNWIFDKGIAIIEIVAQTNPTKLNNLLLERKREINKINAKVGIISIIKYYGSIENLIKKLKDKYGCN